MKKDSFEKKLAAYVATAAAFLAAQKESNAQVMYTDVNPDLVIENSFFNLDLNNDGVVDFKLKNHLFGGGGGNCSTSWDYMNIVEIQNNNMVEINSSVYPVPINSMNPIGLANQFSSFGGLLRRHYGGICLWTNTMSSTVVSSWTQPFQYTYGNFLGTNKLLGLSVESGGNTYYGWARLDVFDDHITLKDYAINTIPDSSIYAGDTGSVACSINNLANSPSGHYWMCDDSVAVHLYNTSSLSVQWLENGNLIIGANDSVYTVHHSGNYQALVSDSSCAILVNAISVDTVHLFIHQDYIVDEMCGNENGAIGIHVISNSVGYNYNWSNGDTTQNLTSVPAGNYQLIATSVVCPVSDTSSFNINNTSGPSLTEIHSDSACNNSGYIDLSVNSGTSPYIIHWSNSAYTEDLNNLSAGIYSVTVHDWNNCMAVDSIQIFDMSFYLTETHSPTCDTTAYIDLTISDGVFPFSYLWNTGSTQEDLNNLSAGNYSVTVHDSNGCSNTLATSVNLFPSPQPIISQFGNILITDSSYVSYQWYLLVSAIGGAISYQYSPTENGFYYVQVIDSNGCTGFSGTYQFVFDAINDFLSQQFLFTYEINNKKLLFHLTDNALMGAQIDIVNELGQLAASVTVTNQTPSADLSALPGGIYLYHIRSGQKTYSGKFIIE